MGEAVVGWAGVVKPWSLAGERGDRVEGLSASDLDQLCLDAGLRFLAHRPRSEWEVRTRLTQKGHESDRIDRIVARLRELKLLDDRDFASFWLENRAHHQPRGDRALRAELLEKRVPREVVDAALAEGDRDEAEDAYRAALKRAATLASLDESAFRERLSQFLARRGFDWETTGAVVERLWRERDAAR